MSAIFCLMPDNAESACIQLKHGFGSRAMNDLIEQVFVPEFGDVQCSTDSAIQNLPDLATKTVATDIDAHVVDPPFFPGGNIGTLAAAGTINDMLVVGAIPFSLAVSFILTEGYPIADLKLIVESLALTARDARVKIVTGDTKVLPKNVGCGVIITTAGLGYYTEARQPIIPRGIKKGDAIIVTGPLGQHFAAIYTAQSKGKYTSPVRSDVKSLHNEVDALLAAGMRVHCMRDLTRGGLSAALVSIATDIGARFMIEEVLIPHHTASGEFCEITGYDLLSRANEGRMVVFVDPGDVDRTCELLHDAGSPGAVTIGSVQSTGIATGDVIMKTLSGSMRRVLMPDGSDLNRIC